MQGKDIYRSAGSYTLIVFTSKTVLRCKQAKQFSKKGQVSLTTSTSHTLMANQITEMSVLSQIKFV